MNILKLIEEGGHVEKSLLRRVSGAVDFVYVIGRSGQFHHYRPGVGSRARLERVKANYGIQVHPIVWDFPDKLECPEREG